VTVTAVAIHGYRSIRDIHLPLRRLTVLVGGNGVGKTNLYRSLELLQAAAKGTLAEEVAREGGLGAVHFAGELKRGDQPRVRLEATLDHILEDRGLASYEAELGFPPTYYNLELGFKTPSAAAFIEEAQVKSERLVLKQGQKEIVLVERSGPAIWTRDEHGRRAAVESELLASETALSSLRGGFPTLDAVRHSIASWRFYHGFRVDAESPLRKPGLAITSPMLNADGSNLAAVFATLRHIREDSVDLDETIESAFPGSRLIVPPPEKYAEFSMIFPDLPRRAFSAAELSDGTLHFLALCGALLSYRLPPFIALNEPETSLHPDLLPALAGLIAKAAERTQIWVVTHSHGLANAIAEATGVTPREVVRRDGATWIEGLTRFGEFDD